MAGDSHPRRHRLELVEAVDLVIQGVLANEVAVVVDVKLVYEKLQNSTCIRKNFNILSTENVTLSFVQIRSFHLTQLCRHTFVFRVMFVDCLVKYWLNEKSRVLLFKLATEGGKMNIKRNKSFITREVMNKQCIVALIKFRNKTTKIINITINSYIHCS